MGSSAVNIPFVISRILLLVIPFIVLLCGIEPNTETVESLVSSTICDSNPRSEYLGTELKITPLILFSVIFEALFSYSCMGVIESVFSNFIIKTTLISGISIRNCVTS